MDNLLLFSISADGFCLLLSVIGILIVGLWREALGENRRLLLWVFSAHLFHILANLLGLVFKGGTAPCVHAMLTATNFAEFETGYVLSFLLSVYIIGLMEQGNELRAWRWAAGVVAAVGSIMLVISQFTGIYYTIDAENYYHRGPLYPVALSFGVIVIVLNLILMLRHQKNLEPAERVGIWCYLLIPAVGMAIQPFIYGVYVTLLADTLAMTAMFMILVFVQTRRYYEKERQLTRMRMDIALSQIQPHFLYNVLNSIYHLCGIDPGKAQEAVADFSDYLRGNLDSLGKKTVVPFETELQHLEKYLALEKLRYDNLLEIDVSGVDATGFLIPFMSVQPLVENAVKHGLGNKSDGGTVWVESRETEDGYEVVVRDDGVGFDPAQLTQDSESHIGIQNVRARLKSMSNGMLTVESAIGTGTIATIFIPKE